MTQQFKIFDLYDISNINIEDPGLKSAINLQPKLVLKSHGRNVQKLGQIKINIVERLMNKLAVAGHRGKKHRIGFGRSTGKYTKNMKTVLEAFKLIEKRIQKNPVEVLVKAIEKAAPRDEITVIEYGGARYPQAVDVSPLRRVNIALKHIIHGASDKAFNKKKTIAQGLAEEIILTYEDNGESFALRKKNEAEKQADSAR
ncbi:MAG TPA: 30S ribosomal protein S7 [Candidatus Pacearchaeota archaeon]|nr:30S ribosomal protein S7 [archaeon BMS3Abin17]HDK42569.1 30S ribosomal protein S7 [Candidatus Pacearchaeota archaeon]HDZ60918.1 30S ribosomal protein S7 [Candidatus Pacearchaeota archaeon]